MDQHYYNAHFTEEKAKAHLAQTRAAQEVYLEGCSRRLLHLTALPGLTTHCPTQLRTWLNQGMYVKKWERPFNL